MDITDFRSGSQPLKDFAVQGFFIRIGDPAHHEYVRIPYPQQNLTSSVLRESFACDLFAGHVPALHNIALPDMNLYLNWVSDGTLPHKQSPEDIRTQSPEYHFLVRMCVLGNQLQDNTFRRCALSSLFLVFQKNRGQIHGGKLPAKSAVKYAYENTEAGDVLRKMLVEMHVVMGNEHVVMFGMPVEFLLDLNQALFKAKSKGLEFKQSALEKYWDEIESLTCEDDKGQKRIGN
ncbi:unnamed protein product [Zymoseptoria tritici ST99CH_1E4]|nr:unnamed protein product [Zymoseptoria tritici ST99CH_1E4]